MTFLSDSFTVCRREMIRYVRSKAGMFFRIIQPVVWLILMGNIFSSTTPLLASSGFQGSYIEYMTPGIIVMTVMFGSIFGGATLLWDRRFGFLQKMLATPISRYAIPFGKMLALSLMSGIQVIVILILALFLGVRMQSGFFGAILVILIAMALSLGYSGISMIVGVRVRSEESYWPTMNFLGLPFLMLSSALFPIQLMPNWLATLASYNPLTFAINAIRIILYGNLTSITANFSTILFDYLIIAFFALIMLLIAANSFKKEITRTI